MRESTKSVAILAVIFAAQLTIAVPGDRGIPVPREGHGLYRFFPPPTDLQDLVLSNIDQSSKIESLMNAVNSLSHSSFEDVEVFIHPTLFSYFNGVFLSFPKFETLGFNFYVPPWIGAPQAQVFCSYSAGDGLIYATLNFEYIDSSWVLCNLPFHYPIGPNAASVDLKRGIVVFGWTQRFGYE